MQRNSCLGSQWLYYKIYTGVKTADYILIEKLAPVITYLEKKKKIQKWFFIRYRDPEEHLRIRFLIDDAENMTALINSFYPIFKELLDENIIWKIQTDTYQREIERYGKKTIYDSEFLFWKDSKMILSYLSLKTSFLAKETSICFSLLMVDSFLNSFRLSNSEKLTLMDKLQIAFKEEFEIGKIQKKEMDIHYRSLYPQIKLFLEAENQDNFPEIFSIVNRKSNLIEKKVFEIIDKIQIPIDDFLSSHIHMMINRQYTSKQRTYELVVYDHLYRYYKTLCYKK
ncbi:MULTISPECIES: thiopeptide-type bacteriocin biosynthesis protein [Flavobacterium]|uniref:Thiopeptide-type bacteriocin biosynthesis protein n=1 Tax=Flavobacterium lipolyticum TaxID=2893754 RepID=A0ABS8LX64_9FLAO|nr:MULTISPECIES: thiopeptide-type bacteriocin biosynthesis protein [unclassified Flavobacterium]MCC9016538.1 thiopeptide-type bacteriocin biosynthesis protein [Flavobacterium sp. F-126]